MNNKKQPGGEGHEQGTFQLKLESWVQKHVNPHVWRSLPPRNPIRSIMTGTSRFQLWQETQTGYKYIQEGKSFCSVEGGGKVGGNRGESGNRKRKNYQGKSMTTAKMSFLKKDLDPLWTHVVSLLKVIFLNFPQFLSFLPNCWKDSALTKPSCLQNPVSLKFENIGKHQRGIAIITIFSFCSCTVMKFVSNILRHLCCAKRLGPPLL